jgi:hypothetical protein
MSAQTMTPEGFAWPPINGSSAPFDNAPTQPITVPGLRTEAFEPAPLADTDQAIGGLSLGALLAAEIRATGGAESAQVEDVSMTWGILRGLHGESDELATRHRRPSAIVKPIPGASPAEDAPETVSVNGRVASLSRLAAARRAAAVADETVEMPATSRSHRSGSAAQASFTHAEPAEPVIGFAAQRDGLLNSPYARRRQAEQAVEAESPTVEIRQPQPVVQPVSHEGASRKEHMYVRSHRRGMRSAQLLLKLVHALPFGGRSRGRHAA